MMKILTACTVFCAIFVSESQAEYNVTDLQLENSYTFTRNFKLYTIWMTSTTLNWNSTLKHEDSCSISIDPKKDFTIDNRIQATSLTDTVVFVVWGTRSLSLFSTPEADRVIDAKYTVLILYPWICEYKSVQLPAYRADEKYSHLSLIVVANAKTFDVFHPGQPNCSPCRFDNEGKQIQLDYQLEFSNSELASYISSKGIQIYPMHKTDRTKGYFLVRNFKNNTAVMELLDERFKTTKRLYVDHPVQSVSVWPGVNSLLSVCYISSFKNLEAHCQQLDSKLQPILFISIPVSQNNLIFGLPDITHQIDPLGNIYIGMIEASTQKTQGGGDDEFRQIRYFVYDKTGKLLESHDFDKVSAELQKVEHSQGLHSHVIIGSMFCMVNEEYVKKNEVKTHEIIRCSDISKYYKRSA